MEKLSQHRKLLPDTVLILAILKLISHIGKNGKNDPLKTAENDPLKLCRPNSKKLSSGLGSKRRRFKPELNFNYYRFPQLMGPQILQK